MSEIISLEESRRLVELENIVQRGLQTFVEVGEALAEIRDSRLYRVEFDTFEDYCRTKWKFTRMQASRLIGAASAAKNVTNLVTTGPAPARESQARPLTKLPAEKQPEAWSKAVEIAGGEQPTAKQVEQAVARVAPHDGKIVVKIDVAERIWTLAKSQLDKIIPEDVSRTKVFADVLQYAEEKLNRPGREAGLKRFQKLWWACSRRSRNTILEYIVNACPSDVREILERRSK